MKRNLQAGVRRNAALRLEVFTGADLDDIHRATLEVLERTGVFVESDEALDVFADGGCRVDRETKIVKILSRSSGSMPLPLSSTTIRISDSAGQYCVETITFPSGCSSQASTALVEILSTAR